ncbi:MAG: TolC family protein [Gemmatimonadaceae bacterium]|nr:TolC family protein [Gemmatimonadaceae bacterium]
MTSTRTPASRGPLPSGLTLLIALAVTGAPLGAQGTALSLGDAARLAAKQSGGVEVARTRVAAAEARVTQRRGALMPDLAAGIQQASRTTNSATFGFSFRDPAGRPLLNPNGEIIGPVPTVDVRYRIQQPLLDLGNLAKWRAAQAATDAASADVNAQAEAAASVAAAIYVRAARAEAQVAARVADSALAADLLRIARDQLQAGVGIALDVTRAQSQLASTRAQIIIARNDRDRALLELKRAMGMSLDAALTLRDSLGALPVEAVVPDEAAALDKAGQSRADIRALVAQEAAQQRAISAIRWERTPQLGLMVDHGVIGKNWGHLLSTYTWGVQLSVGLFDGFRREGRVQEQLAGTRETDARLRDLRAQSALDVRAALLDLSAAREQLDAVRERLALSEQEVAQAQERFRAGVAGNADVISALLSLNSARTLRNDVLAAYQTARVSLARAVGGVRELP